MLISVVQELRSQTFLLKVKMYLSIINMNKDAEYYNLNQSFIGFQTNNYVETYIKVFISISINFWICQLPYKCDLYN